MNARIRGRFLPIENVIFVQFGSGLRVGGNLQVAATACDEIDPDRLDSLLAQGLATTQRSENGGQSAAPRTTS